MDLWPDFNNHVSKWREHISQSMRSLGFSGEGSFKVVNNAWDVAYFVLDDSLVLRYKYNHDAKQEFLDDNAIFNAHLGIKAVHEFEAFLVSRVQGRSERFEVFEKAKRLHLYNGSTYQKSPFFMMMVALDIGVLGYGCPSLEKAVIGSLSEIKPLRQFNEAFIRKLVNHGLVGSGTLKGTLVTLSNTVFQKFCNEDIEFTWQRRMSNV